jgi:Cu-processing system ATP-binding protein
MNAPVLEAKGLKKGFGPKPVLRGIDLTLTAGRHAGLVGNNGEGKTTLLRLLLGLLRPDGGTIRICGQAARFPRARAQKRLCGYLPESVSFYPNLTGRRTLRFLARLKGADTREIEPLLELVGLREAADEQVKTYSKGMRQRLGLAQALLGDPVLLLLDEPTNGLDPEGIREFYAILENLQSRDVAILTASHLLAEIEPRLDHLALLRGGVFQTSGSVPELIAHAGLPVTIKVALKRRATRLVKEFERLGAVPSPNGHPDTYEIQCAQQDKLGVLSELLGHQRDIRTMMVHEPGLEEVFSHHQSEQPPPIRPKER